MLSARDWVYLTALHLVITTQKPLQQKWTYIRFCCLRAFCFLPIGMYFIVPSVGMLRWPVDRLCFQPWATFTVTHLASSFVRTVSLYGWKASCSDCPFTARIPIDVKSFFSLTFSPSVRPNLEPCICTVNHMHTDHSIPPVSFH